MKKGGGISAIQTSTTADLPFACYICRQPFTNPVVTLCGHYFDERCALQRYTRNSRCAACGKETSGSFRVALEITNREQKQQQTTGNNRTATTATDDDDDEEDVEEVG